MNAERTPVRELSLLRTLDGFVGLLQRPLPVASRRTDIHDARAWHVPTPAKHDNSVQDERALPPYREGMETIHPPTQIEAATSLDSDLETFREDLRQASDLVVRLHERIAGRG